MNLSENKKIRCENNSNNDEPSTYKNNNNRNNNHVDYANENSFEKVINYPKITLKILKFLPTKESLNLLYLNKNIYNILKNPENFIMDKYLLKRSKKYLLIYKNMLSLKYSIEANEIKCYSDKVYRNLYKKTNKMITAYYFIGLILVIDGFCILVTLKSRYSVITNNIIQIPFCLFWLISLLMLVIYYKLERNSMNEISYFFDKELGKNAERIGKEEKKEYLNKLKIRMANLNPVNFKTISILFVLIYIPILLQMIFKLTFESAFEGVIILISIIVVFFEIASSLYHFLKNRVFKKNVYKEIYGNSCFFQTNMQIYKINESRVFRSEIFFLIQGLIWRAALTLGLIFYFSNLGEKIDKDNDTPWPVFMIPVFLLGIFILIWGIVYIYSLSKYKIKMKWVLFVSISFIIVGCIFNTIILPLIIYDLDSDWVAPSIVNIFFTISTFAHHFLLKYLKRKYSEIDFN